jgi:Phosphotransferase enzyme family
MTQPVGAPKQRVGTAELRAELQNALGRRSGTRQPIAELERRPTLYSTSFAIEELDVRLADGTSLELVFKDLSRQALLGTARRIRPAFVYSPLREIETYRTILAPEDVGTATCYGTVVDHRMGRYWLFLERVPGIELYQVGELATWKRVACWLALLHSRFAGRTEPLARAVPLLSYDGGLYRLWMRRAQEFSDEAESSQPKAVRRGIKWLAKRYNRVVERLLALPVTFIHGEFYASNVLVHNTSGKLRVCPVDWEMAAVGPGLIDLAALISGGWTAEEKEALAKAYHAGLAPCDEWWTDLDEFLIGLDHCRLHLAVQWLGWAPGWSPPPEHAQDWLGEALSLAERLELA